MRFWMFVASTLALCTAAQAGFSSWTTETEEDPFSGGKKITADYTVSLRSGVFVFCDTAETGIEIRSVPGFEYNASLEGFTPTASFAIDGKRLFDADGEVGAVGNNIAAASFKLDAGQAKDFVQAFMSSKKQIAIKDGIADRPQLLSATGSTKTGQKLKSCLDAQNKQDDLTH